MHLAVLFEYPTLQGGERSLLAVVKELERQNSPLRITALAHDDGPLADELRRHGVAIEPWFGQRGDRPRPISESSQQFLADQLNKLQPDIIHANSVATGRLLGRIADRLTAPTTAHLRDIIGLSAAAVAELNRHAQLIAVSEATRAFHAGQGLAAEKCDVIHNGIDLDEFAPRQKSGRLHAELRLPPETPLIATIGQICLRKGWDTLTDAAILLARSHADFHLLLIGTRHSQKLETREYEEKCHRRFYAAGLTDRVHWLGERSDVPQLLNEIELLVHPARQEPLGRVLLEGLASGVPMVATDVGGTREIIDDGICGTLVRPDDPPALAAAMSAVLSDPQLASRFRHAGRRRAEERFGIATSAQRLWDVWHATKLGLSFGKPGFTTEPQS